MGHALKSRSHNTFDLVTIIGFLLQRSMVEMMPGMELWRWAKGGQHPPASTAGAGAGGMDQTTN
jgi:hypothetical protein